MVRVAGSDLGHALDDRVASHGYFQIDACHCAAENIGDEHLRLASQVVNCQIPGTIEKGGVIERLHQIAVAVENKKRALFNDAVVVGHVAHNHKPILEDAKSGG